jgi:UDP-N-acetyl-2-amino-2-deoxyglucuronate dehydrogenase
MDRKIRFAVIGCGHIGKRHAEMVFRNEESELVALIDINEGLEDDLTTKYNTPFYTSFEEYMNAGNHADVLCIATPNGLHATQALKAIEKGHHIVVEKPMGLTKKACEDMIYKALHHSKHVFCVMQNRYSPPSEWMKKVVSDGILGDIYMVQVNCYWNRDERYYKSGSWHGTGDLDGGTLFTQFSHFIDLMYWVFGDIDDVKASFANHSHGDTIAFEDSGLVSFKFINGGMGCINYSTSVWDKNLESSMTVVGQNGSIKVGGQYMDKVEYCHIKDYEMPELKQTNPPNDYGQYKGSAANHHYVIENVVDVLKGRAAITTNALEGLKVVDIIERIYSHKK